MEILHQILLQSAIGTYSRTWKNLVISLFFAIVCTLLVMFATLLLFGHEMNIRFGY